MKALLSSAEGSCHMCVLSDVELALHKTCEDTLHPSKIAPSRFKIKGFSLTTHTETRRPPSSRTRHVSSAPG